MKELLEKYYNGETTPQEEDTLREWMLHGDVPEELAADREMFLRLEGEKGAEMECPAGLEQLLDALISREAEKEARQQEKESIWQKKHTRIRHLSWWVSAVAACAVLILGITYLMRPVSYIREVEDPQEASMYINMAMTQFSKAIDCGHRQMEKVGNAFEKLNSIHLTKQ